MEPLESQKNLGEMVVKTLNNLKLGESLKLKSQCLENIVKNRKFFCSIALWSRNKNPMKILPSTLKTELLERAFGKFYWSAESDLKYEFLCLLVHPHLKQFTLPIFSTKLGQPPACLVRLLELLVRRAPNLLQLNCQADLMGVDNATAALIVKNLCRLKRLQVIKCPYTTCTQQMLERIANNLKELRQLTVNVEGETRRGLEALSRLPQLRHLYFSTVNSTESERRRLQLECFQLLPNLHRGENYYAECSNHNSLFSLTGQSTELQLEHVSLRHALPVVPPTCRLANVRSLRLLEPHFLRPPAVFLAAFDRVTSLHASELDGRVLRQVLAALGGRLTKLTLHEQQCHSLSEVFHSCPQLEEFHSSFCSYGPSGGGGHDFPVGRLRHLEVQVEREGFVDVSDAVLQLLRAPLLEHLHFFGLDLRSDEVRPLVRLLRRGVVLTRLHTVAVFKRKINAHGRCLVDNIIVHCPSIKKFHAY